MTAPKLGILITDEAQRVALPAKVYVMTACAKYTCIDGKYGAISKRAYMSREEADQDRGRFVESCISGSQMFPLDPETISTHVHELTFGPELGALGMGAENISER